MESSAAAGFGADAGLEVGMNVIDFFEYLAASDATRQLAYDLADVWVEHQLGDLLNPAA
jgi:hypothetical protein